MSIIARTAAGAPVASIADRRTGGPAHRRATAITSSAVVHTSVSAPDLPAQPEPALLQIDHQHLGAALARDQADALADRPRAEHDDALAGLRSAHASHARTAIDTGSAIAATAASSASIGNTLVLRASHSRSCKPAVDVDPDQLEVVARVRAPDAARVALAARVQRPHRDAPAGRQLRRGNPARRRRSCPPTSWPWHARELRAAGRVGQLAGEEVVVRAADPDRLGMDHDLARTRAQPAQGGRSPPSPRPPRSRPRASARPARSAPDLRGRLDDQLELRHLLLEA